MFAFDPMSQGAATTGETCQYDWLPTMSWVLSASTKNAAMAASGAVNRLGRRAPAVNPSAEKASRLAATTAAGHHSGPPQLAWCAVVPYRTARQTRYPARAQQVVAAHVGSNRAHRGRTVIRVSSEVRRGGSRGPLPPGAPG